MEILKKLANPEPIKNPNLIDRSKLTVSFIRQEMPDLYALLKLDWLYNFHVEDLEELPEPTLFDKVKPFLPWAFTFFVFLLYVFKK